MTFKAKASASVNYVLFNSLQPGKKGCLHWTLWPPPTDAMSWPNKSNLRESSSLENGHFTVQLWQQHPRLDSKHVLASRSVGCHAVCCSSQKLFLKCDHSRKSRVICSSKRMGVARKKSLSFFEMTGDHVDTDGWSFQHLGWLVGLDGRTITTNILRLETRHANYNQKQAGTQVFKSHWNFPYGETGSDVTWLHRRLVKPQTTYNVWFRIGIGYIAKMRITTGRWTINNGLSLVPASLSLHAPNKIISYILHTLHDSRSCSMLDIFQVVILATLR